jgi:hypothetical protein
LGYGAERDDVAGGSQKSKLIQILPCLALSLVGAYNSHNYTALRLCGGVVEFYFLYQNERAASLGLAVFKFTLH